MRVFITGASGFIGSQLARLMVNEKAEVHALLRPDSDPWRLGDTLGELKVVKGDLLHPEQGWLEELETRQPEICFHFAWYAEPGVFLTSPLNLQYLAASLWLAEGLAKAGCKKLVMAGSFSEYDQELGYLSESSALKPNTPYGAAKVALYQALSLWAPRVGVEVVWPRIFSVYGPMEHEKRFVPAVIVAALRGVTTRLSPGEQLRDYMHVSDTASAVWAVSQSDLTGPVNIGSGKPVAIGEIARQIGEMVGKPELIRLGDLPYRPGDPMFVCANTGKLASTGWKPNFDLESGLRDTIEWWKGHLQV
jgi:nucleoside-diphosphate-sugar epimerase